MAAFLVIKMKGPLRSHCELLCQIQPYAGPPKMSFCLYMWVEFYVQVKETNSI